MLRSILCKVHKSRLLTPFSLKRFVSSEPRPSFEQFLVALSTRQQPFPLTLRAQFSACDDPVVLRDVVQSLLKESTARPSNYVSLLPHLSEITGFLEGTAKIQEDPEKWSLEELENHLVRLDPRLWLNKRVVDCYLDELRTRKESGALDHDSWMSAIRVARSLCLAMRVASPTQDYHWLNLCSGLDKWLEDVYVAAMAKGSDGVGVVEATKARIHEPAAMLSQPYARQFLALTQLMDCQLHDLKLEGYDELEEWVSLGMTPSWNE